MNRTWLFIGLWAGALLVSLLALACGEEAPVPDPMDRPDVVVLPTSTPQPTPTPAHTPAPEATPTVLESLLEFVLCDRLRVTVSMLWGQAPGVIYSGDPRITGRLEDGDYIQLLMSSPVDGKLRVKVYPHDYRVVGNSDDRVWIDWGELVRYRLDREVFICED